MGKDSKGLKGKSKKAKTVKAHKVGAKETAARSHRGFADFVRNVKGMKKATREPGKGFKEWEKAFGMWAAGFQVGRESQHMMASVQAEHYIQGDADLFAAQKYPVALKGSAEYMAENCPGDAVEMKPAHWLNFLRESIGLDVLDSAELDKVFPPPASETDPNADGDDGDGGPAEPVWNAKTMAEKVRAWLADNDGVDGSDGMDFLVLALRDDKETGVADALNAFADGERLDVSKTTADELLAALDDAAELLDVSKTPGTVSAST